MAEGTRNRGRVVSDRLEEARRALADARRKTTEGVERHGPPLWEEPSLQHAMEHAPDAWKNDVVAAVERLAEERDQFTADDVWVELAQLGDRGTLVYEPRALGPILMDCARRGLIENSGTYAPSKRRRGSPIIVWKSRNAA